jgi:hypothetical protein
MMGVRTPETCWTVNKRQVINWRNCCIYLVDLFELYDDARTDKLKIFLSTLFSNTFSLCPPSMCLTDQVKKNSSVYLSLYIFGQQIGRQKILHRIIARFPWLRSALKFFMTGILIRYCCSRTSELFHTCEGFITYMYIVILYCMLVSRHDHVLSSISIYF